MKSEDITLEWFNYFHQSCQRRCRRRSQVANLLRGQIDQQVDTCQYPAMPPPILVDWASAAHSRTKAPRVVSNMGYNFLLNCELGWICQLYEMVRDEKITVENPSWLSVSKIHDGLKCFNANPNSEVLLYNIWLLKTTLEDELLSVTEYSLMLYMPASVHKGSENVKWTF